jgi:hypothetical protein
MSGVLPAALLLGVMLLAIGGWTIAHPNGGYRAAGGIGSGLAPSTRRSLGVVAAVVGAAFVVGGLAGVVAAAR